MLSFYTTHNVQSTRNIFFGNTRNNFFQLKILTKNKAKLFLLAFLSRLSVVPILNKLLFFYVSNENLIQITFCC